MLRREPSSATRKISNYVPPILGWNFWKVMVIPYSVRYTTRMQSHYSRLGPKFSGVVVSSGRRGAPFVPGVLLICLALVVIVAPKLVFGALAFVLLSMGLLLCYVAYRIVRFKRQLSEMARDLEKRFYVQSFPVDKPDIDITDIESKKIILH